MREEMVIKMELFESEYFNMDTYSYVCKELQKK